MHAHLHARLKKVNDAHTQRSSTKLTTGYFILQENELAKIDRMQDETIVKLRSEVEAGKQTLELLRVQCEARENELLAAQAQSSMLQEIIKELNEVVTDLRARFDREETEASSGRALAQRELYLEQSKAQMLEQQLQVPT
jgi:hypothetical protein